MNNIDQVGAFIEMNPAEMEAVTGGGFWDWVVGGVVFDAIKDFFSLTFNQQAWNEYTPGFDDRYPPILNYNVEP